MRPWGPPLRGGGRGRATTFALASAALAIACAPEPPGASGTGDTAPADGAVRVIDDSSTEILLPGPARRIVSLVPSATQTLHEIGAGDAVVGRTDYDTLAWTRALPSVGQGLEPNMEAVVSLEPDLVIRFGGTQDPRTPSRLDALGIAHLAIRPDHVADIYRITRTLGAVTGHEAEAESLTARIRQGLDALAARTAVLPRTRVAYVLGGNPPWVSGPGTYIDEILSLAGGENVFSDLEVLYSSVSPEQLRTRDVEVVLFAGSGTFDASLTPGARIVAIGGALEIPGPGVVDAAYHVAELLHGRSLR